MNYVLINPKSNGGKGEANARQWAATNLEQATFVNVLEMGNALTFVQNLAPTDTIIIAGGDGTLNHFVNDLDGYVPANEIYYLKSGSGNDFFRDLTDVDQSGKALINKYITNLPVMHANGKRMRFLNGVGGGIDGEVVVIGESQRQKTNKPINYTTIALKLLLGKYKKHRVTVTVDGVTETFDNVWLASTMKGHYYGGGMMIAPQQDRLDPQNKVTLVCVFKRSRLVTLLRFKSLFKGGHVKWHDWCKVFVGKSIKVHYERPCDMQIDGELLSGVTDYTVEAE